MMSTEKEEDPVLGIPYDGAGTGTGTGTGTPARMYGGEYYYHVGQNPYQAGMIPPNAIFDDPKGLPIHQTIFRDTPAPFDCVFCGHSGLTSVKSKPSLAAAVACMSTMGVGFCFLLPSMDYLWHKYHYCPSCEEKVGEFEKTDPFIVADPPNWVQRSFALSTPR